MASLNIRGVSEEQMRQLNESARREGMTLRSWVLAMLLEDHTPTPRESDTPAPTSPKASEREQLPAEFQRSPAGSAGRPDHNVDTCTVYHCGMCAAAKLAH